MKEIQRRKGKMVDSYNDPMFLSYLQNKKLINKMETNKIEWLCKIKGWKITRRTCRSGGGLLREQKVLLPLLLEKDISQNSDFLWILRIFCFSFIQFEFGPNNVGLDVIKLASRHFFVKGENPGLKNWLYLFVVEMVKNIFPRTVLSAWRVHWLLILFP